MFLCDILTFCLEESYQCVRSPFVADQSAVPEVPQPPAILCVHSTCFLFKLHKCKCIIITHNVYKCLFVLLSLFVIFHG